MAQLLVSAGPSSPTQLPGCRAVVAASCAAYRPAPICPHRAIQRPYALRRQSRNVSPRWPQWSASAALSGYRLDAAPADATRQQHDPALVIAHRLTGAVRFALRDLLLSLRMVAHTQMVRVAIYGAGEAGAQLAAALRLAGNHQIVTFLDDAPTLWRRTINGIPIKPPQVLSEIQGLLDQVLLAIPSLPRSERRRIVADLQRQAIPVLQIPSVDDLTSGRALIDALRPVAIEDLLGRDPVPPMPELLGPGLRDAVVCVTGAGGSIGSELCRQILRLAPKALILLESSEPSLYALDQELRQQLPASVQLLPVLGSAADPALVQRLFAAHGVQTVFHAAAYKHVPLVEVNPLAGLANNVGSTRVVCQAAVASGVSELVLISTDKAVRPTNVMGASKRLAELLLQASALELLDRAAVTGGSPAPVWRWCVLAMCSALQARWCPCSAARSPPVVRSPSPTPRSSATS